MVGRKPDYLAGIPSGTARIGDRLREYVDRGRFWAALQFAAYRLQLPPFWITVLLALRPPGKLLELMSTSDAVIVDFPFLFPAGQRTTRPVVLNTHNVEADLWRQRWIRRLVAHIERRAARSASQILCCSEQDRAHFASLSDAGTIVVPNGIDPARFRDIASQRASLRAELGYTEGDRVIFFAASSFGPNVETFEWLQAFVAEHQALLARRNLHFLVVGSVSKQPLHRPHLRSLGMVERVEPYFAVADFAFNGAFRGSGTNVKMAEFIAAGLPILTTVQGMRGYALVDREDCLVFAPETLPGLLGDAALLDDPQRLAAMSRSAYEKNKRQIDMAWCIEPLVSWLQGTR
jgi:glycosyltransferase involved in cell wall biosynthesis